MNRRARLALLGVVVVIGVISFVIAQSGGSDHNGSAHKSSAPAQIRVEGGKPVGGIERIAVSKGDRVRFSVTSDVADEVHVHGYDFHKNVAKDGTARFDFPATISGSFEIELESRKEQIASLEVSP